MTSKARDTRERAQRLLNAYSEALVGVFSLRLPGVQDIVVSQAPQMAVKSSYSGLDLLLDAKRIVQECQRAGPEITTTVDQITVAFVAAMWDTLVSHAHYDKICTLPEVQFFRHLRNACAHNGRWNFTRLDHPARWRDKELRPKNHGEAVFGGLMKHGDVVQLFLDIDRAHFDQ